jgi:hypothetical protein
MGELLRSQRPTPAGDFGGKLADDPEAEGPSHLRLQVAAAVLGGLLLLGIALLGASGSGPLGG